MKTIGLWIFLMMMSYCMDKWIPQIAADVHTIAVYCAAHTPKEAK